MSHIQIKCKEQINMVKVQLNHPRDIKQKYLWTFSSDFLVGGSA